MPLAANQPFTGWTDHRFGSDTKNTSPGGYEGAWLPPGCPAVLVPQYATTSFRKAMISFHRRRYSGKNHRYQTAHSRCSPICADQCLDSRAVCTRRGIAGSLNAIARSRLISSTPSECNPAAWRLRTSETCAGVSQEESEASSSQRTERASEPSTGYSSL